MHHVYTQCFFFNYKMNKYNKKRKKTPHDSEFHVGSIIILFLFYFYFILENIVILLCIFQYIAL